jgi:phosphoribosylglycinamide formyltransferase 1
MKINLAVFSTGRDEAAVGLLENIVEKTDPSINVEAIVFNGNQNSTWGQKFLESANQYSDSLEGIPVFQLPYREFEPELRKAGIQEKKELGLGPGVDSPNLAEWRSDYDKWVICNTELSEINPYIAVLVGDMVYWGKERCQHYDAINLHPALPDGPKGTWQDVIWELMYNQSEKTGAMMHLVTPDRDRGPAVTYCEFAIQGDGYVTLWERFEEKISRLETTHGLDRRKAVDLLKSQHGENEGLFKKIRREGVKREGVLVTETLNAFGRDEIYIAERGTMKKYIFDDQDNILKTGYDITEKVEASLT